MKEDIKDRAIKVMLRDLLREDNSKLFNRKKDDIIRLDLSLAMIDNEELKEIKHFHNLQFVTLDCNDFSDISPLGGLKKLKYLNVEHNRDLKDLSPLAKLDNLKYLYLYLCPIEDYSPLAEINSLEHINISENNIKDEEQLRPLLELDNLKELVVTGNPFIDKTEKNIQHGHGGVKTIGILKEFVDKGVHVETESSHLRDSKANVPILSSIPPIPTNKVRKKLEEDDIL